MWETISVDEHARRLSILHSLKSSTNFGFAARKSLFVLGELTAAVVQGIDGSDVAEVSLADLAANSDPGERSRAASSSHATPQLLSELSKDSDFWVRACVARNLFTPLELLEQLAKDQDVNVVVGVCVNPRTPASLLSELALRSTGWSSPGSHACSNPALPIEALQVLVEKRNRSFIGAFQNHAATPDMLEVGVHANTDELVYWTATNPFLTKSQFESIVGRSVELLRKPDFGGSHFRRWKKQIEILETVLDNPSCEAGNLDEIFDLSGGSPMSSLKDRVRERLQASST